MSLETQIAGLVEAANNLTDSVSGKMQEIDQGLSSGLQGLEDKLSAGFSGQTRYCSPTGSNSAGDGSQANPFRSIAMAINSMYRNGEVVLYPGSYYYGGVADCSSRNIEIRGNVSGNRADYVIEPTKDHDGNVITSGRSAFFHLSSSNLSFSNLTIDLSDMPEYDPGILTDWGRSLIWSRDGFNTVKIGESGGSMAALILYKPTDSLAFISRSALSLMLAYSLVEYKGTETTLSLDDFIKHDAGTAEEGASTFIAAARATSLNNITTYQYNYIAGIPLQVPTSV